jgi:hypothetical protein
VWQDGSEPGDLKSRPVSDAALHASAQAAAPLDQWQGCKA